MTDVLSPARKLKPNYSILLLTVIIAGPLLGGVLCLLSFRQHLIFLTPGIVGLAGALFVAYGIWRSRVRRVVYCIAAGVLMAAVIYTTYQITSYVVFRKNLADTFTQESPVTPSQAEVDKLIDDFLMENTGQKGIAGYIQYQLKVGMVIRATPLPAWGYEILGDHVLAQWAIDAGILLVALLYGADRAVHRRYCESCGKYYGAIDLTGGNHGLDRLGWVENPSEQGFADLLKRDHLEEAGALLRATRPSRAASEVLIERCDTCTTNPFTVAVPRYLGGLHAGRVWHVQRDLTAEEYERLTTFAPVGKPKPAAGGLNRWLVEDMLVITFLSALVLALSFVVSV